MVLWRISKAVITRIRSVERNICPTAAVCTVLLYCPDFKPKYIRVATVTLRLDDVISHLIITLHSVPHQAKIW